MKVQAKNLPLSEPPGRWAPPNAFFGVGLAIAIFVAVLMLDRGSSMVASVIFGAVAGGFGSFFVFHYSSRFIRWARSQRRFLLF
jgi:hypothetical protein